MRLPIKASSAIRVRKLIPPKARVLVALSGGPDSVALLLVMKELSKKRDLSFSLTAAHLNHGIRGKSATRDQMFCRKLCKRLRVPLAEATVDVPALSKELHKSVEETARIVRKGFLEHAAYRSHATHVAVAHHADDRIETVLYRLCRGTGLNGLVGIGWNSPLEIIDPQEREWVERVLKNAGFGCGIEHDPGHPPEAVRPLLAVHRDEIIAYLKSKRQKYCSDETNFDTRIPRNAVRRLVLPVLEEKVHPGVRSALWRLAEEADFQNERRAWTRAWLAAFAALTPDVPLELPVPPTGAPPTLDELSDALSLLKSVWSLPRFHVNSQRLIALRGLFGPSGEERAIHWPSGNGPARVTATRAGKAVRITLKD